MVLSEEQSKELSSIAQSRSLPAGYVFRARLILMLAEGATFCTIKQRLELRHRPSSAGRFAFFSWGWIDWIRIIRARRRVLTASFAGQDSFGNS